MNTCLDCGQPSQPDCVYCGHCLVDRNALRRQGIDPDAPDRVTVGLYNGPPVMTHVPRGTIDWDETAISTVRRMVAAHENSQGIDLSSAELASIVRYLRPLNL